MDIELNEENCSNIISSSQIFQIRQQILAYKHIIKGLPIPKEVEKNLVQINKEQWEVEKDKIFQKSVKFYKEKIEKTPELTDLFNNRLSKKIDEKFESFLEFSKGKGAQDVVQKKMETRIQEIENLLKMGILDEESVQRLEGELTFLKNKEIYMKVKENILSKINKEEEMPFKLYEKSFFSLAQYKREKPQKRQEVQIFIIFFKCIFFFYKNLGQIC